MKYGYTVKFNGEYYPAGAEVPEKNSVETKAEGEKPSVLLYEEEGFPKKKPGRPPKNKE